MIKVSETPDFPEHADAVHLAWDANACWWDDAIGDGNDFQTHLIEPATERLLDVRPGERILDIACGAGRLARRIAALGASVVAFDQSSRFIERARQRATQGGAVTYHVLDASEAASHATELGAPFDQAVCTMALMDMPEISPVAASLALLLVDGAAFVFSVTHPCFNMAGVERFVELGEDQAGRACSANGVKVTEYRTPFARETEGIVGQPVPHHHFHRPLHVLLAPFFGAGFAVTGIEEPVLPQAAGGHAGLRWADMPEIPPVLVVRMRRGV